MVISLDDWTAGRRWPLCLRQRGFEWLKDVIRKGTLSRQTVVDTAAGSVATEKVDMLVPRCGSSAVCRTDTVGFK